MVRHYHGNAAGHRFEHRQSFGFVINGWRRKNIELGEETELVLAIEFSYPSPALEAEIIAHESGIDASVAASLAFLGGRLRNLDEADLIDGPSTRLLIYVGALIRKGVSPLRACEVALVQAISDDRDVQQAVRDVARAIVAE